MKEPVNQTQPALPLVTVTVEAEPGERAAGARSARPPPGLEALEVLLPSLELEFVAEVASLVHPGRVVCSIHDLQWLGGVPGTGPEARLTARAAKMSEGWVGVSVVAEGVARLEAPRGEARVEFAHHHAPPPSQVRGSQLVARFRGHASNDALYGRTAETGAVHERLRALRWTAASGLGRLAAGMLHDEQLLAPHSSARLITAPATVEAMLQLCSWLWYGLSGQGSRPVRVRRLAWHQLPRQGEPLVLEAALKGQSEGQPILDVCAYGQEGQLELELQGVRLVGFPLEARSLPRPAWQERHRLLQGELAELPAR